VGLAARGRAGSGAARDRRREAKAAARGVSGSSPGRPAAARVPDPAPRRARTGGARRRHL